jgi:hypothetical protein
MRLDSSKHINELELLGALFAFESFLGEARELSVRMYLDNTTTVCYINKNGGTRSLALSTAAVHLTEFCESRRLSAEAVHLAGVLNVVADRESRSEGDFSDWMLCRNTFDRINGTFPSRTDLFSSEWNAQLPNFFSWGPQPGTGVSMRSLATERGYQAMPSPHLPLFLNVLKKFPGKELTLFWFVQCGRLSRGFRFSWSLFATFLLY